MKTLLARLAPGLSALLLVVAPAAAGLQDPEELPDKREEVKALLDEFAGHVKKKGDEDDKAIAVIDQLYQEFENSGPKDRAAIVKGLEKCFSSKRKAKEDGTPDNGLYIAAATAMRDMGPECVKPLIKLIGHKNHRNDLALQRRLILSLIHI